MYLPLGVVEGSSHFGDQEQRFPIICIVFWNESATWNPDVSHPNVSPLSGATFARSAAPMHWRLSATHVSLDFFPGLCVNRWVSHDYGFLAIVLAAAWRYGSTVRPAAGFFLFWDGWDGIFPCDVGEWWWDDR